MTGRTAHFEVFQGGATGRWYWRLVAANGLTVADGGEGYATRSNVMRAIRRLTQMSISSEVRIV